MVGDMEYIEDIKVKANSESERKEIQELLSKLGYNLVNNIACEKGFVVASLLSGGINFYYYADVKEITVQYLKDLVVLKRNSIDDASFKDTFGDIWYVDSNNSYWMFENGVWREADEPLFKLEPIKKEGEVKMKEKEYIAKVSGAWRLVDSHELVSGRVEVPEGAEEYRSNLVFYKNNGKLFYTSSGRWAEWEEAFFRGYEYLWQRNTTTPNTSIQEKLKFIEKWLNGEKIQYILGVESEKTQPDEYRWHNFTEGAMQCIKRSDIKFREAPKYVTINGIDFKNVESILNYIKSNFDLEDGG